MAAAATTHPGGRSLRAVRRSCSAATAVLALLAALVACLAVVPLPAAAQDHRVPVLLDGSMIFRVGPIEEVSAADRAKQIERRIDLLLASPDQIGPATVEHLGPDHVATIMVAGVPIVVVTQEDADDNLTTVDDLAATWAATLDADLARAAERRHTTLTRFLAQVRAAFNGAFVRLFDAVTSIVPQVLASLLVLLFFGLAARFVRGALRIVLARSQVDPTISNLIRQVVFLGLWLSGILAATAALGFDPQTVVAGLGLTSLALGFGLRDIVANYTSGMLLLAMRPFKIGDSIQVDDTEGTVQQIDLRATHVRTFDGQLVLVPNADVFSSKIVKNTAPLRRTRVDIPLPYDTDLDRAVEIAGPVVAEVPGVLANPVPSARIGELKPDGAELTIFYWADTTVTSLADLGDQVRREVVAALRAAGVRLPDPEARLVVRDRDPASAIGRTA